MDLDPENSLIVCLFKTLFSAASGRPGDSPSATARLELTGQSTPIPHRGLPGRQNYSASLTSVSQNAAPAPLPHAARRLPLTRQGRSSPHRTAPATPPPARGPSATVSGATRRRGGGPSAAYSTQARRRCVEGRLNGGGYRSPWVLRRSWSPF